MRHAALALLLLANPALARMKSSKTPKEGQFCSKKQAGSTVTDAKGQTLTCRAGKKGKLHWEK